MTRKVKVLVLLLLLVVVIAAVVVVVAVTVLGRTKSDKRYGNNNNNNNIVTSSIQPSIMTPTTTTTLTPSSTPTFNIMIENEKSPSPSLLTQSNEPSPSLLIKNTQIPSMLPTNAKTLSLPFPTTSLPTTQDKVTPTMSGQNDDISMEADNLDYEIIEILPHDPTAFTQGLISYYNDSLNKWLIIEGTGLTGQSLVRMYDPYTGIVYHEMNLDDQFFGEGLTLYYKSFVSIDTGERQQQQYLIHLTWTSQIGFIYDPSTLQQLQQFTFTSTHNEGWGITFRETTHELYMSDGSQYLHVWDPTTLQEIRKLLIQDNNDDETNNGKDSYYDNLNELEWDSSTDTILANVWEDRYNITN